MSASSLELSATTEQRIRAAANVLRISPDALLRRLLSQHYNTLGGLPLDLLRYILTFLDYTLISGLIARVSKFWQDCVMECPQNFFSRLRQIHGIHLLDPVHGMFYFPRALKRVVFDTKNSSSSGKPGSNAPPLRSGADLRRAFSPASAALQNNAQAVPASSFLTVDIRTQNTRTLPWGYVQMTVRRAIERERLEYGAVRTPGLQRPEDPVWSQAATVTYDRRIYMFGGETYEGVVLDRVYEYDPMAKHWTVLPDMMEKRAAASAVVFRGRIFVFGGYNEEGEVLDTYEVLDVASRSWVSRLYPPSWMFAPPSSSSHNTATQQQQQHARHIFTRRDTDGHGDVAPAAAAAASGQYRMPEKLCGTASTVYGDVILFAGGHQSCIAPDQTAVSYSAMNSTSTTPMHGVGGPATAAAVAAAAVLTTTTSLMHADSAAAAAASSTSIHTPLRNGGGFDSITTPTTVGGPGNTGASTRTNSPPRLPRVNSIALDGPATAETLVWVFSPVTGEWWREGPRLPSPRAFGALTVLDLPILGPCLCYFGGCARADAPETAMFYIPLNEAPHTRVQDRRGSDGSAAGPPAPPSFPSRVKREVSFLHTAQEPWPGGARAMFACAATASAVASTPTTQDATAATPAHYMCGRSSDMVDRCFRDQEELPWQRYVRIPIGGAFTSVAVVGSAQSRTVVLTGFYPAPNIGFCKVASLLPPDAFTPLLGALSPPMQDRMSPLTQALSTAGEEVVEGGTSGSHTPPAAVSTALPTLATAARHAARASSPPPLQLDASLQNEAAAAAIHFHQEREWSHHQRQEVREMVRSAARAATLRHPRNPQTAGEEHKWNLAPVPEVRVRNPTGPALSRVSWKVQSLNAKVIVGIE